MTIGAVEKLTGSDYEQVWTRFEERFRFRPGMTSSTWPAISEPANSTTWALDALDDDPGDLKLDAVVDAINSGLWACTPREGTLLILDWHHLCYRIRPHAITTEDGPAWPKSMMPDGDYITHLAEDFSYGTFGHPWENSICVMGTALLVQVASTLDDILVRRIREGGLPASSKLM